MVGSVQPSVTNLAGRSRKCPAGSLEVAERELEEPDHAEVLYLEDPIAGITSDRHTLLRCGTALLGSTEVGVDERPGVHRQRALKLEPAALVELMALGRQLVGSAPVA